MDKSHKMEIAVLGSNPDDAQMLQGIIEDGPYRATFYPDLIELKDGLHAGPPVAAILDIDSVPLDNRTIRRLTLEFPSVSFFCTSHRFHPELKEAICYHLFACLRKPVDPEELHYFLRCIRDNETESRGPPRP